MFEFGYKKISKRRFEWVVRDSIKLSALLMVLKNKLPLLNMVYSWIKISYLLKKYISHCKEKNIKKISNMNLIVDYYHLLLLLLITIYNDHHKSSITITSHYYISLIIVIIHYLLLLSLSSTKVIVNRYYHSLVSVKSHFIHSI